MKNGWFVLAITLLLFTSCIGNNNTSSNVEYETWHSLDSSFCINFPRGFSKMYIEPSFIAAERNKELISVMREDEFTNDDFVQYVESRYKDYSSKFNVTTLRQDENVMHKRVTSGLLFSADDYYFRLKGGSYDYIIWISSESMDMDVASNIASSLKEYTVE